MHVVQHIAAELKTDDSQAKDTAASSLDLVCGGDGF